MPYVETVKHKATLLSEPEAERVVEFMDYLLYRREQMTDAALLERIESGLSEEFLPVREARRYLAELADVAH